MRKNESKKRKVLRKNCYKKWKILRKNELKKRKVLRTNEIIVQKAKDVEEQAGAELCQAQLKLWLGLFCFRLNDNSSS